MAPELLLSLVAIALSTALASGALAAGVLRRYAPERKRLRQLSRSRAEVAVLPAAALIDEPSALAERICRIVPRSQQRMGEMRRRLISAGLRSPAAPVFYAASQIVCAIITGI